MNCLSDSSNKFYFMKGFYNIAVAFFLILISSCTKISMNDMQKNEAGTSYVFPVCTYNASVLDMLKMGDNTFFNINSDQTIAIECFHTSYDTDLSFVTFDHCRTADFSLDIKPLGSISSEQILPDSNFYFSKSNIKYYFNFDSVGDSYSYIIDSAYLKSPYITLNNTVTGFTLNSTNTLEMKITLVGCKGDDGKTFSFTHTIDASTVYGERLMIPDFYAIFSDAPNSSNLIKIKVNFKLHSDGTQRIYPDAKISTSIQFLSFGAVQAYGKFRNDNPIYYDHLTFKIPEELINAKIFNDANLKFSYPQLSMKLSHNVITDLTLKIDDVYAIGKDSTRISSDFEPIECKLSRPNSSSEWGIIDPNPLDTIFSRSSGINEIFKNGIPDYVVVDYSILLPKKSDSSSEDYICTPMKMSTDFGLKLNMSLDTGSYVCVRDTVDADLSGIDISITEGYELDTLFIFFDYTNSIPLSLESKITFHKEYGNEYVNPEPLYIDGSDSGTAVLAFSGSDINKILETKKIIFETKILAEEKLADDSGIITIKADDALKIDVRASLNFNVEVVNLFTKQP